jgi:hypothetical protein
VVEHNLTRDEASSTLQPYLNPLPRAVTRTNKFALLDGEWRFDLDPQDRGLQERWYLRHTYSGTVQWPRSIEAQLASMQENKQENRRHNGQGDGHGNGGGTTRAYEVIAWYEREFEVPPEWLSEMTEVQVTFGACGYETRVWLNGKPLLTTEGEEAHLGGYTSFSYELPREQLLPVNRLTVRVSDTLDPETPRGKQESRVYKRGGIWYQSISGPVRSIWIEPIERSRLRSRVGVRSCAEERLVEFQLTTRVHHPGPHCLRLVVSEPGREEPLAMKEVELLLDAGEHRQHLAFELPDAKLWSPSTPNLYQLVAQLTCPTGHVSQIEIRFGLRQIEARGRYIYLNGKRIYLDGILYQPAASTFEEMRRHVYGVKKLGCNLLRVHISGIDPRIYELADELGMLVWVEVPSPHQSSARSRAEHWAELQRMLIHICSHPSVVILSLYNEDWGVQDIATNREARAYIIETYEYLQLHYPQFLVVDNDGWQHISIEGRLGSDLLTAHLYQTDVESWRKVLDQLVTGEHEKIAALPLVICDPFFYGGQVPLLVSEWGGFGFAMYGGPDELASRAERIRAFKHELVKRPIAGDVYTQATNIEEEINGLLDPKTGELLVPPGLLSSGEAE